MTVSTISSRFTNNVSLVGNNFLFKKEIAFVQMLPC